MLLKTARIRHFKSLDDVELKLSHPITVLVGPNAAGKSNLVDSLRFLRDAVTADLEHAVSKRGGIGRIRQISRTRPFLVSMLLEFHETVDGGRGSPAIYNLQIQSKPGGNYNVASEQATWSDDTRYRTTQNTPSKILTYTRNAAGMVNWGDDSRNIHVPSDQLVLGRGISSSNGWPIARFIRNWQFSTIYPNMLRQPASPDRDRMLAEDGANWASVIKAARRTQSGRAGLERLAEAMRVVIPGFVEVTVTTVGNYLVPKFKFTLGTEETIEFDPAQLSDGTLRLFGILLALYQEPAPALLVVEEPEQTVNPGVLGVLADAFREASERTQIVLTTHSPEFIDYFKPEEIRVVSLSQGLTKLAPVKKTQIEAVKRRLMSLSDFMQAEGLQPEVS